MVLTAKVKTEPIDAAKMLAALASFPTGAKVHNDNPRTIAEVIAGLDGKTTVTLPQLAEVANVAPAVVESNGKAVEQCRLNAPYGTPEFRSFVCLLFKAGRIVPGSRGRTANVADRLKTLTSSVSLATLADL